MRTKKVNRYYCDYCRKSGCSAGHMRRHEERCTLNPERKCGMCGFLELRFPFMGDMLAVLPSPADFGFGDGKRGAEWNGLCAAVDLATETLREMSGNCPVCILAALRQGKVYKFASFEYHKEVADVWAEINDREARDCWHG